MPHLEAHEIALDREIAGLRTFPRLLRPSLPPVRHMVRTGTRAAADRLRDQGAQARRHVVRWTIGAVLGIAILPAGLAIGALLPHRKGRPGFLQCLRLGHAVVGLVAGRPGTRLGRFLGRCWATLGFGGAIGLIGSLTGLN